jgi:hypothetical protein
MAVPAQKQQAKRVLLAMGDANKITSRIQERLERQFGLEVVTWNAIKDKPPADAGDFVLDLFQSMNHCGTNSAHDLAMRRHIPWLPIQLKWSHTRQRMIEAGFIPLTAADGEEDTTMSDVTPAAPAVPVNGVSVELPTEVREWILMGKDILAKNGVSKLWIEREREDGGQLAISFEILRPVAGAVTL